MKKLHDASVQGAAMHTFHDRKETRRRAYAESLGKRAVFNVYVSSVFDVLPRGLSSRPIASFASKRDAEQFVNGRIRGQQFGSQEYGVPLSSSSPAYLVVADRLGSEVYSFPACYVRANIERGYVSKPEAYSA